MSSYLGWKITLTKATWSNLPCYYLSSFRMPKKIVYLAGKIQLNFLRNSKDTSKPHLIRWSVGVRKWELGLGRMAERRTAMLSKWLWRFLKEQQMLWARLFWDQIRYVWDRSGGQSTLRFLFAAHSSPFYVFIPCLYP